MSFLSLDGIYFRKPVNIGSIIRLESQILNTSYVGERPAAVVRDSPSLAPTLNTLFPKYRIMETQHVRVQANVVDVKTGREETTNDFRFTFARDDGPHEIPNIIPRTYQGTDVLAWVGAIA